MTVSGMSTLTISTMTTGMPTIVSFAKLFHFSPFRGEFCFSI
jgi:hypothetical protein